MLRKSKQFLHTSSSRRVSVKRHEHHVIRKSFWIPVMVSVWLTFQIDSSQKPNMRVNSYMIGTMHV